jgi:hypothetical protein
MLQLLACRSRLETRLLSLTIVESALFVLLSLWLFFVTSLPILIIVLFDNWQAGRWLVATSKFTVLFMCYLNIFVILSLITRC